MKVGGHGQGAGITKGGGGRGGMGDSWVGGGEGGGMVGGRRVQQFDSGRCPTLGSFVICDVEV